MEKEDVKFQEIFSRYNGERAELIPILQDTQAVYGYLPEKAMRDIARFMGVPQSQVYGVATFFGQFYFSRRGKHAIKVCLGTACHVRGAGRLMEAFEREMGVKCGCITEDYSFSLERVNCVGACAIAPVVMVGEDVYGHLEGKRVKEVLNTYAEKA